MSSKMTDCAGCLEELRTGGTWRKHTCSPDDAAHELAARTGEEPEEPRDTIPTVPEAALCSVCAVAIELDPTVDNSTDPLYCEPCHDKVYP